MSLFFPSAKNSKMGPAYKIRLVLLLLLVSLLTWYGKFHEPTPRISRDHGLAVWAIPHARGLSALVVLPDDDDDGNEVSSGMRLWLSPPREPAQVASPGGVRYRGPLMVLVGDSLPLSTLEQAAASVDTGGHVLCLGASSWPSSLLSSALGPRRHEQLNPDTSDFPWVSPALVGSDVKINLRFLSGGAKDYILDLVYEGHRVRLWSSPLALQADTSNDTLSVGLLLFSPSPEAPVPLASEKRVRTLLWAGSPLPGGDSTRIALGEPASVAVAATQKDWTSLKVKRLHLQDWNPKAQ